MRNIFKRRRDARIAYYWQLNMVQWHSLTDFERSECRRNVTAAPRFGVGV